LILTHDNELLDDCSWSYKMHWSTVYIYAFLCNIEVSLIRKQLSNLYAVGTQKKELDQWTWVASITQSWNVYDTCIPVSYRPMIVFWGVSFLVVVNPVIYRIVEWLGTIVCFKYNTYIIIRLLQYHRRVLYKAHEWNQEKLNFLISQSQIWWDINGIITNECLKSAYLLFSRTNIHDKKK